MEPAAVACNTFLKNCAVRWESGSLLLAEEIRLYCGREKKSAFVLMFPDGILGGHFSFSD